MEIKKLQEELRASATGGGDSYAGHSDSRTPKTLVDARDYKLPQMPETRSALHFAKWRHDGLVDLEAHNCWNNATAFLHEIRQQTVEISSEVFDTMIKNVHAESQKVDGQDAVK